MPDRAFLRWPFFDDAHRRMAEELDAWVGRELGSFEHAELAEEELEAACRRLVAKLGEGGWLRYCVPAAYGGVRDGLDVRSLCLARETLARTSGLADVAFAMQGLGSASISLYGAEALKRRYLPGVATGEHVAAFAVSEPAAGSDVGAIRTAARKDGGDYVLDGTKTWISNAGIADHVV